jgi:phage gp36-like protein
VTYAVQADMVTALGDDELTQLTDRASPPVGAIDAAVLTRALEAADGEIDSYLASRYSLPLSSTPPILRDCAIDIARYRLHDRAVSELVANNYKARQAWLRDVAAGKASLGIDDITPASAGLPEMTSGGRVFARETDYLD